MPDKTPIPANVPGPKGPAAADGKARAEIVAMPDYDHEQERRKDNFFQHAHRIAVSGIWIASGLGLWLVLVAVWHMAGPEHYRWLDTGDVEKLFALLSGAGAAVMFGVVRNYLDKN